MPFVKNYLYRDMPFSKETPQNDFYTYSNLADLVAKCTMYKYEIVRCRSIGVLQSRNGRFYLTDLDSPSNKGEPQIQVSMVYLKLPPQSTVIPYPVQIFGTLQWKNRPVIYAKILQMLNAEMAIRFRETLNGVTRVHLARINENDSKEEIS